MSGKTSEMSNEQDTSKLWGGRFSEATDAFVQRFTASVDFDQRMAGEDIEGSLAHAAMLHDAGVLTEQELSEIRRGLGQVQQEINDGSFQWSVALEDVLMESAADGLHALGILCKVAVYPVVRRGDEVLRFTLTARHTDAQLRHLEDALLAISPCLRRL